MESHTETPGLNPTPPHTYKARYENIGFIMNMPDSCSSSSKDAMSSEASSALLSANSSILSIQRRVLWDSKNNNVDGHEKVPLHANKTGMVSNL